MKTFLLKRLLMLGCSMFAFGLLYAQPVFNSVTPNTATPAKFDKFELNINLTASYTNAYDYDDIAIQCIFTSPSAKKDTVDGFFMQDYTLDVNNDLVTSGLGTFKVRYAPAETGTWSYVLSCTNLSGTTTQPAQIFQCVSSAAAGFIRKNTTNYLSFDNGAQYIPIGENMGWQDNNVVNDYTNWLTKLTDNGGNFIRVWMSDWAFALEWKNGSNGYSGLKKYKQSSAFYLDWLLDYCKQKDVYMMLCLNHHGQVSSGVNPEWSNNPYNAVNGGPCTNTWDFFTNATAKALHKNRTRYIMARYGYAGNIMSWELFNEVEWTDQYDSHKTDVKDWHQEMADYIKSKDVYRHLVTTSFAHDYNDDATWNITALDFTQTHYYVSAPNIESVMASGTQNYLTNFNKPTLNGEFGLGPDGATLTSDDPDGVHIHNAIWGSTFSGAMGSGMTWWWDSYINPQNLYYHYKPLSTVVSLINFKGDDYKKMTATTTGGGTSDLTISPGAGFVKAPASAFTIDAQGNITPDANQLSAYIFGNVYNTIYRNPPTFHVNYPVNGQFKVVVTSGGQGTASKINLSLDGTELLNQNIVAGTTYTINVPAGTHDIKVDNLGTDWFNVSSYIFTNIGSPLSTYILKSSNSFKAAGWALNNQYNWQYLKNNGNVAPPPVQGSSIIIPGMQNGTYTVHFLSTSSGNMVSLASVTVSTGQLTLTMPDVAWDMAFTAVENSVLPIQLSSFNGETVKQTNHLNINIAEATNVKEVYVERSSNGNQFTTLKLASNEWRTISGSHIFIDETPLKGNNFYRLRIVDNDGKENFSAVIKLFNDHVKYSIYPNPFKDYIILKIEEGKYEVQIIDNIGRIILKKSVTATNNTQDKKLPVAGLKGGIYFIKIIDEHGNLLGSEKIQK